MKNFNIFCLNLLFSVLSLATSLGQVAEPETITTPGGVKITFIKKTQAAYPENYQKVKVYYKGCLTNGECFDSVMRGKPFSFKLGKAEVIPGWEEAVRMMPKGSKAKIYIPSALAYGHRGIADMIPPDSDLIFDLELLDSK